MLLNEDTTNKGLLAKLKGPLQQAEDDLREKIYYENLSVLNSIFEGRGYNHDVMIKVTYKEQDPEIKTQDFYLRTSGPVVNFTKDYPQNEEIPALIDHAQQGRISELTIAKRYEKLLEAYVKRALEHLTRLDSPQQMEEQAMHAFSTLKLARMTGLNINGIEEIVTRVLEKKPETLDCITKNIKEYAL